MFANELSGFGKAKSKRKKRYQKILRGAVLIGTGVAAAVLVPKLIAHFQKQGMTPEQAKVMADKVQQGLIPMPKELAEQMPELTQSQVPAAPVETTVFGLTLPTLAVIGVLGVGAYMVLSKKKQ